MRIQHNIMVVNTCRSYTNNVSAMKGNLEKLSSGFKINCAGDPPPVWPFPRRCGPGSPA